MFQTVLLKFAPPKLLAAYMRYVLPVAFLARWLFQNVYGLLLLCMLIYWLTWSYSSTRPLTAAGLALWLDDLPIEAKAATLAIVMTVVGFLIAFHTASVAWKKQARAKMQLDAAEDIETFFNEFLTKTVHMQLVAERVLEAARALEKDGLNPKTTFSMNYALSTAGKFLEMRDRLGEMSSEMNRLQGRHGAMLVSIGGAVEILSDCIAAAHKITDEMWIYIPLASEKAEYLPFVAKEVNEEKYTKFSEACDCYYPVIAGLNGALRGLLLTPMTEFNLSWLVNMKRLAPSAEEGFEAIQRAKRRIADEARQETAS